MIVLNKNYTGLNGVIVKYNDKIRYFKNIYASNLKYCDYNNYDCIDSRGVNKKEINKLKKFIHLNLDAITISNNQILDIDYYLKSFKNTKFKELTYYHWIHTFTYETIQFYFLYRDKDNDVKIMYNNIDTPRICQPKILFDINGNVLLDELNNKYVINNFNKVKKEIKKYVKQFVNENK
jgi:hypothetical protein